METSVRHVHPLMFTIVAQPHGHYVEYAVYDIVGWDEKGTPRWHGITTPDGLPGVEWLEEAQVYLHGSVKWDGCSNWYFDEQNRAMLHGCCKADVQRFGDVMALCWEWTGELLSNWSPR